MLPQLFERRPTTRLSTERRIRRLHLEQFESRQLLAGLRIEKFTNGIDVPAAPGPSIIVGDSVTWTYEVTNTGALPMSGVTVTDDAGTGFTPLPTQSSRFISAAGRVDTVHDAKRGLLYISTTGGQVLRYDLMNRSFLTPFNLGGSLRTLDLSPDQDTLVVANATANATTNQIHVIDLRTDIARKIEFPLQSLESGTYSVAFSGNSSVLVTSNFNGSGWIPLRKVDLTTNTFTTIRSVRQSTMLSTSADLSAVGYAESNISSGSFGRYRTSDGNFAGSGTNWFAFEIGVSRNAAQIAVPSYAGTFLYDANFTLRSTIGIYADEGPIGLVYSPVADVVFFAWADYDNLHASIDAYDTNTFTKIATIDATPRFDWTGNASLVEGRLKISRDARWLFSTVDNGVIAYGPDDFRPTLINGDGNGNGLLDPGERWRYQATGTAVTGQYTNVATVTAVDTLGQADTATDSSYYLGVVADYGDAPTPYATRLSENGPRHISIGSTLGAARDTEADGSHATAANTDDTTGVPDDEDGVTFGALQIGAQNATATVNVSGGGGKLDAWIDFNGDGSWGGPGEQIFASQNVAAGVNNLTFDVPSFALAGTTYARFRLSAAGGLGTKGTAADGEVEDYLITLTNPPTTSGVFGGPSVIAATADGADSVFAADVDRDGDVDVLSASSVDHTITWHENGANQSFTSHAITTSALGAAAVFAADVDGDGDVDVLSASELDDKVAWYENDGGQNFTLRTISTTADGARSVFAADVDGDGDTDVLSASYNDDKIAWYENDGGQNFTLRIISTTADGARSVFAADVDGDGDLDVLSASFLDNKIAWYENNGGQNFTLRSISTTVLGATSVFASDVDNDGDLDVLSASAVDDKINWYANDGTPGNGGWIPLTIGTAIDGAASVFAADLDGDGDVDVISASSVDDKVTRYENDGTPANGGWTNQTITAAADGAAAVFAADVDNDGDLDILSASQADDKISFYENVASDFSDAPAPYPTTSAENGARHALLGPKLGAARDRENNGIHSLAADADDVNGSPDDEDGATFGTMNVGRLGASMTVNVTGGAGKLDAWIDFNGDGAWGGPGERIFAAQSVALGVNNLSFDVPNFALAGTTYARLRLSTAGGLGVKGLAFDGEVEDYAVTIYPSGVTNGNFGDPNSISTAANGPQSVFTADIDGDGDLDILSASYLDNKIAWYENDGNETFTPRTISTAANRATSVFAADVDNDGDLDVLSASLVDDKIAWYENDGSQNFTSRTISNTANGAVSVFAADVDGDGDTDILSASSFDNRIAWYTNDGTPADGGWFTNTISSTAAGANSVFAADIDADGDMDVLSASQSDDKIAWYDNNGSQVFTARTITTAARGAKSVYAADMDGDGDMDVLSASSIDNKIAWYANDGTPGNGGWITNPISMSAAGANAVFAADADGDGDIDVYSASSVDDKIAWFQNDGSQNFTPIPINTAASGAHAVLAADVDGDGDLDVVSASYNDDKIVWYENVPTLHVLAASATPAGAKFVLSDPVKVAGVLNLYDFRDAAGVSTMGAADVQLTGETNGMIGGSLIVAPDDKSFTFVASNGVLSPDKYTLRLRSASDGFISVGGQLLDGNADGAVGDDFTAKFTIGSPPVDAVTLSLPFFARGPQQVVNVPESTAPGLPLNISSGANLVSVSFELRFDSGLLNVTDISLAAGITGNKSFGLLSPGRAQVTLTFSTPLSGGSQTVAYFTANVPTSAANRYGERGVLDLTNITLTASGDVSVPAIDQDAAHVNTYFGDVSRDGVYNSFDVQQVSRAAVGLDTGYQQHLLLDPRIISDFDGVAGINSFDVQRVSRLAVGLPIPESPALPFPPVTVTSTDKLTADEPNVQPTDKPVITTPDPVPTPPAPQHNAARGLRSDVDNDGVIDAQDILWAVFLYNQSLKDSPASAVPSPAGLFADVNGDNQVDPADILFAVSDFNLSSAGEGESAPLTSDRSASAVTEPFDSAEYLDSLTYLLATDAETTWKKK